MTTDLQGTLSVVSHGHGALLHSLLADLAQQTLIDSWLIIVTLNIAEDFDTASFPNLRIMVTRNARPLSFGANHNAASRLAQGRLFLIVNPDIRLPDADTLVRIVGLDWDAVPAVLRAPVVLAPDGALEDSVRANLSPLNLLRRHRRSAGGWEADPEQQTFFWLAGMFLISSLAAFRAIGGFDERFRLYCEDYDLSARWWVAGGRVEVIRDLHVIHAARRASRASLQHMRWHVASLWRVWTSPPFWRIVADRAGARGKEVAT